jgi:hypothetical protein
MKKEFALSQNYPNPFNPVTVIHYALPVQWKANGLREGGGFHTRLEVYNLRGQRVRTLVDGAQESGYYKVIWDGKDEVRRPIASGVYFYRIMAGKFTAARKMTLLK